MNIQARPKISAEEQARRRKIVESATWSARMEGFGDPLPERVVLDELYIAGEITREERRERLDKFLKEFAKRA